MGICSVNLLSSADVTRLCDLDDLGCNLGEPGGFGILSCSLELTSSLSALGNILKPIN